jgi:hypothetical protein
LGSNKTFLGTFGNWRKGTSRNGTSTLAFKGGMKLRKQSIFFG